MAPKFMSEGSSNQNGGATTDQSIPVPIQIFLWKQMAPFVRPKFGKLHEAACMFCQQAPGHHELKEACKSFEKVLVQNLKFGLAINLCDAMDTIPRWRLIQSALPHVLHALASLLQTRVKDNMISLGTVETKLLYTLHWILIDASDECAESDYEKGIMQQDPFHYLFSVPTMTLFIYLFAPISQHLKESDFTNYRLENGLKLWQAMWDFRHPDASCFTAHVKPQPKPFGKYNTRGRADDMFVNRKQSKDDQVIGSPASETVSAPQAEVTKQASTEDEPWLSSPKDTAFPETIPEESSSLEEEHVFIYRLPSMQNNLLRDPSIYTADASLFQIGKISNEPRHSLTTIKPLPQIGKMSSADMDSVTDSWCGTNKRVEQQSSCGYSAKAANIAAATFLDVAAMRCLFISEWQEEGVYWALHFLYNRVLRWGCRSETSDLHHPRNPKRLRDISEEVSKQTRPRKRSNSLPIPKIEVSIYQSPEMKKRENMSESPDIKDVHPERFNAQTQDQEGLLSRRCSEKTKRKMKMADLKAFVETKLLSKSEKALEKIGHEGRFKDEIQTAEYHRSLDTGDERPNSVLGQSSDEKATTRYDLLPRNLVKGKSMPSLRFIGELKGEKTFESANQSHNTMPPCQKNPIITVTEHTPSPTPDNSSKSRQGSLESQMDSASMQGSYHLPSPERKPSLTRSQTDSNITYIFEDVQEAFGSINYITKEGDIDFFVVLKAIHSVSIMEKTLITLRVVEVILNLIDSLMDIGVLKESSKPEENQGSKTDVKNDKQQNGESNTCGQSQKSLNGEQDDPTKANLEFQDNPHYIILNILMRTIKVLGCGGGGACGGSRGPLADTLRVHTRHALSRLRSINVPMFVGALKYYAQQQPLRLITNTLHAMLVLCDSGSHQKRSHTKSPDISHLQQAYASNFNNNKGASGSHHRIIDGVIIEGTFKIIINRLAMMHKERKLLENSSLYKEVRLLINYVKDYHGGVFRLVALSGLFDTAYRPGRQESEANLKTTRVIRHILRSELQEEGSELVETTCLTDDKISKKGFFKKRSTSSTCASMEVDCGTLPGGSGRASPRQKRRRYLQGIVNWFRHKNTRSLNKSGAGSGESLPISGSMVSLVRPHSHVVQNFPQRTQGKRRVGHTLNRAKRQVEDRLNRFVLKKMAKKKDRSVEEPANGLSSRRGSYEGAFGTDETEVVILKRRRLVNVTTLYKGMANLTFLMEATQPGTLPDPLLMQAILDLPHTAVVARACFLLECAHLVHNCNKGQWPHWMRASVAARPPASVNPILKKQRMSAKMFYQWAEAIGNRLEYMMTQEKRCIEDVEALVADPEGQRELLQQDEEEDFLDDASLKIPRVDTGLDCPRALRFIACMLLYEITAFLRETTPNIPKSCRSSMKERAPWERVYSREESLTTTHTATVLIVPKEREPSLLSTHNTLLVIPKEEANRRWSMAISSMGHSQASAQSLQSIADGERKISFALHEPENVSGGSSNATLVDALGVNRRKNRGGRVGGTGSSFKRRSIKLRHKDRDFDELNVKPQCRKVSSVSDRSDTSEPIITGGPGVASYESDADSSDSEGAVPDSPAHAQGNNAQPPTPTETDFSRHMPWGETIEKFMNSFNYKCSHQSFCHPFCYRRNMRASARLIRAVQKVYGEKIGPTFNESPKAEPVTPMSGETPATLKYIKNQVREASHAPLATLVKGAMVLNEETFAKAALPAWELLLEGEREVVAYAASTFILAALKTPNTTANILTHDLHHEQPDIRINAILRFQVLWRLRYQVWPRMEESAALTLKVPPPGIEFTLPSPKIGIESLAVVDPPWAPCAKDKDMEMTLNQERHRSLVTATKTRKKQKTEAMKRALQQHQDKKKAEREKFLITTIPITRQAASEPNADHTGADDHIEADEEISEGLRGGHHTQLTSALFPSALCAAVSDIVALLDDPAVSLDGSSVYEVAYQVIWGCLVEDSALFLRSALERVTRANPEEVFKLLRHLIRFVPRLPQQAAFALYNYIIGYVMFYVRSSHSHGQALVGAALSILWMVVHSVHGIMFKDLKQILRKEQCDASILLTANVPSAKKIVVHGPEAGEEGGIPSQFPVQEDTQFCQILRESLDFFGISEKDHKEYFLVDHKTRQIHNPLAYVRDHYFFKRCQYPQLELVHMTPSDAFQALQQRELDHKFVEIGKVLLTWAILKNVDMVVQRVVFLHEELMKLPSFPRKALEADLDLCNGGQLGPQLLGLDVLHKFMWVRLIARMFEAMAGNFAYSGDIHLFLNVLNGALMLHSEDSLILRYVVATYVNAAFNFKSIFSTNGYLMIMPTLLQIYSNYETNKLVTTTIEYAVKQFYLMNRKPFILQMFGSVSAILDHTDDDTVSFGDSSKVQSSCLFNLLLSLETPSPDPLHIAELIKEDKPLKPIDFCYRDEDEMVNVLDCISMCVMVVSYSAESLRGYQMLVILAAILPCYVKQIQQPTYNKQGKAEKEILSQLAVAIRTLVTNCEGLAKSYNGPYRSSPTHGGSSTRAASRPGPSHAAALHTNIEHDPLDDDIHSKYMSEISRPQQHYTGEDSELVRAEYRRPRDVLLLLVSDFLSKGTARLNELNGNKGDTTEGKPLELLDSKSHTRLADIAHSLLKVSPYDPESMGSRGLQRYMSCVLPMPNWADDALKPALILILRRLDKLFLKIAKKTNIRRNIDWDSAAGLLKGVYETMIRNPYIMNWPQIKGLLNTCQSVIVSDVGWCESGSSASAALLSQPPPAHFCSTVVRLIALLVVNSDGYTLEQMCGGSPVFATTEKTENILLNLFMPLCLRVGSGRRDVPPLRHSHISFIVSVILSAVCPGSAGGKVVTDTRTNSLTYSHTRDPRANIKISNQLYKIAFLALKIVCACFTQELSAEWGRIGRAMRELGRRNEASAHLWDFLQHVVTYRTPLYILLLPFIVHKLSIPPIGDHERHMQFVVRERVRGLKLPAARARSALLADLAKALRDSRHEHHTARFEQVDSGLLTCNVTQTGKRWSEACASKTPAPSQQRPSLISLLTHRVPRTPTPDRHLNTTRESLSSSSTASQQHILPPCEQQSPPKVDLQTQRSCSLEVPQQHHNAGILNHSKLRFVPSVEFKISSGETSSTPLSPLSPPDNEKPYRLQRSNVPSKKVFKFRRSRRNESEETESECGVSEALLSAVAAPAQSPPSATISPLESLSPTGRSSGCVNSSKRRGGDISGDSGSHTSSTSGYRESFSLQTWTPESPGPRRDAHDSRTHSPDDSLSCPDSNSSTGDQTALLGAASQHSILTGSDIKDEDTLI